MKYFLVIVISVFLTSALVAEARNRRVAATPPTQELDDELEDPTQQDDQQNSLTRPTTILQFRDLRPLLMSLLGVFLGQMVPYIRQALRATGLILLLVQFLKYAVPQLANRLLRRIWKILSRTGLGSVVISILGPNIDPTLSKTWGTWARECRMRSVCEAGLVVARRFTPVAMYGVMMRENFHFLGALLQPLMEGFQGLDCGRMYPSCPYMPLRNPI